MVNKKSDTDLGNTTSAPRAGERATMCWAVTSVGARVREAGCSGAMHIYLSTDTSIYIATSLHYTYKYIYMYIHVCMYL